MPGGLVVELLLVIIELIRTRARRAEIRVQALPAPRGLDDEHRLCERGIHREAEGEFGADFAAVLLGVRPHSEP